MGSLRTLKINFYKNVKNLNIPRLLQHNTGLKNLEIHMDKETDNNLEHEMYGDFPPKLQNLTLTGRGLKKLGTRILEGVKHPSFHFCLRGTSVSKIPGDLFRNMVWVRNISVDVRHNPNLKNLQNPSTGPRPNLPRSAFLTDLQVTGAKWICDCDLGYYRFFFSNIFSDIFFLDGWSFGKERSVSISVVEIQVFCPPRLNIRVCIPVMT